MATIKIKELPIKKLNEISPEDIMVIEDKIDTYQITVKDLQLHFSSDNKINAIKAALESTIKENYNTLSNQIKDLKNKDTNFENRLNDLYNDHENTKKRLGNLIEQVVDIENSLLETIDRVTANETAIKNLQSFTKQIRTDLDGAIKDIKANKDSITAIEKVNQDQNTQINNIKTDISNFKKEYTDKMNQLDSTISNNANTAKEYSDQLYDQIMQYIDFYHHLHEDPPNFDDPHQSDTQQMNLIFKVGTVYETIDPNFDPEGELPGTWKYVGETNVYNTEGETILTKITYVRVG